MTQRMDRFERVLPGLFDDVADARTPDYLEAAIERASSHPQRPAWTYPERWLPMEITTTEVPVARPPWRALGILALIGVLIAGALAVVVGSRPTTQPAPPFGLAENGRVVFARDGDIVAVDPATGATTDLVVGAEEDSRPVYSPDGQQLAFLRRPADSAAFSDVLIAAADGADPVVVTPESLRQVSALLFSPSGELVLVEALRDFVPALAVVRTDGSGFRWLETDGEARSAVFLPPAGESVAFVSGSTLGANGQGVVSLDLESGQSVILVPSQPYGEIVGSPTVSPDGTSIAYSLWVKSGDAAATARHFTVPTDGSAAPVLVPPPATICCEGRPAWSNDGARLAFQRIYDDRGVVAIVPVDGGGSGIEYELPTSTPDATVAWSPDDRYVLVTVYEEIGGVPMDHVVLDATSGEPVSMAWDPAGVASWQRLAP